MTRSHRKVASAAAARSAVGIIGASLTAKTLKHLVHEKRPDHSNRLSFPSDHSAETFATHRREGGPLGAAALIAAALVAAARIAAGKHHMHDALAGAALGFGGTQVAGVDRALTVRRTAQ